MFLTHETYIKGYSRRREYLYIFNIISRIILCLTAIKLQVVTDILASQVFLILVYSFFDDVIDLPFA